MWHPTGQLFENFREIYAIDCLMRLLLFVMPEAIAAGQDETNVMIFPMVLDTDVE
jgi:hypothetical protein